MSTAQIPSTCVELHVSFDTTTYFHWNSTNERFFHQRGVSHRVPSSKELNCSPITQSRSVPLLEAVSFSRWQMNHPRYHRLLHRHLNLKVISLLQCDVARNRKPHISIDNDGRGSLHSTSTWSSGGVSADMRSGVWLDAKFAINRDREKASCCSGSNIACSVSKKWMLYVAVLSSKLRRWWLSCTGLARPPWGRGKTHCETSFTRNRVSPTLSLYRYTMLLLVSSAAEIPKMKLVSEA